MLSLPELFFDPVNPEDCKEVLDVLLKALKHQSFNSRIVECGLRFLALYAKNYPDLLRQVLLEHQAGDSFLELVQSVRDQEMIAHGITIISALFTNAEQTEEDNEKI